ncbi:MAG: MATE family efflux transporter [Lawsonibacter sp.]|nr:MATE family efflux transporter [Lawsonibacter sp.]
MFSYMKQKPGFYREVAALATPIVLQNLITSSLNLVDTFMVGMLGEVPMAAVTLANVPLFVIQLFIFGVQSGSTVLFSQYWGKRDMESINRVFGVALYTVLAVASVMAVVLLAFPVEFLRFFGNQQEVIQEAARYGRWAGMANVCNSVTCIYVSLYRSMEKPKLGMYILTSSMLVNTFLNWVLIFGKLGAPALGVEGAALATLTARVVELLIVLGHIRFFRSFQLRPRLMLLPGRDMVRRFLVYGGPVVFNETTWGLGASVFPTIMGHMEGSTEILAAYTVAGNVDKICMVVSFGLGATASIIIGREVGAGRPEQVRSMGLAMTTLAVLCGCGIGAVLLAFAHIIAPALVFPLFKMSARASSVAVMMMTVQAAIRPVRDCNSVAIVGVLRGGGDVKIATLIDTAPQWFVAIPAAVLLGSVLKVDILWVYLSMTLENVVKSFFGLRRVASGSWIRDLTRM